MGKYDDSVSYYDQAVPLLEELDVPEQDPVGFANYLGRFADALKRSGDHQRSKSVRAKAEKLLSEHSGQSAKYMPVLYSDVCK